MMLPAGRPTFNMSPAPPVRNAAGNTQRFVYFVVHAYTARAPLTNHESVLHLTSPARYVIKENDSSNLTVSRAVRSLTDA